MPRPDYSPLFPGLNLSNIGNGLLRRLSAVTLLLGLASVLPGCGGGDAPQQGKASLPTTSIAAPNADTTATAKATTDDDDDDDVIPEKPGEATTASGVEEKEPEAGSVEAALRDMTRLRLAPPPETEDIEKLKADRKTRNEKIVALAQDVITRTHDLPDQERLFNAAVHHLMEARVQLALAGSEAAVESLYGDAGALFKRDPKSRAAAEGAYALVNLAYSQARQKNPPDEHWLKEFVRQARHYATAFPAEELKAVPLLFTAARSCELNGLTDLAADAYSVIQNSFPRSPFASRAVGISRRLALPGQIVTLSGPKLGGEMVTTEDLLGQTVVVVFWSTEAQPFRQILPTLVNVQKQFAKSGVTFVGVNFDSDPSKVSPFVLEQKLAWPQIVFENESQRGWNNPISTFYGIMDIPAIWVIDGQGQVVSTNVSATDLPAILAQQTRTATAQ